MTDQRGPRISLATARARLGAVDCHHHVYDPRFPLADTASYRPEAATAGQYLAFREGLGFARSVVIQPSVYDIDNTCTLDAVSKLGIDRARAVVVISGDEPRSDLESMAQRGAVGIRLQAVGPGRGRIALLDRFAARAAEMGWHLQLHLEPDMIVDMAGRLATLAVPIVFDHFGRIPHPDGVGHPAFRVIAGLLSRGRTWVKLSAGYHFSRIGPPTYADVGRLTRAFLMVAPERMLWGTDWPHPTEAVKPDMALMFQRLVEWCDGAVVLHRVLVGSPERLYGFAAYATAGSPAVGADDAASDGDGGVK
jgi:predicted TIM-barrel fold metal-dependent hydrolase